MMNGDASGYGNAPPVAAPEFSDEDLALKFSEKHEDELRYTAVFGRWNRWNGQAWHADETMQVYSLARLLCREQAAQCQDKARSNTSKEPKAIASAKTVANVVSLARADRRHAATKEQWDANPWEFNTSAGIVNLKTSHIRPHDPWSYCTFLSPVSPGDNNCDLWLSFLDRIMSGNQALISFLQRMAGYCLTGLTSEHAVFFLYGTGANGKSVFISTLMALLGEYARVAPIEIFMESKNERHPTELAMLSGARLVTATETEEGRRWNESKLKTLTGGDKIVARLMRQDFFEFTPQFKLVIAGNHRPSMRSVDEAIKRRMNLIPFNVTIPPEERDPDLTNKLKAELPGILAWAMAGCAEWQRVGLMAPAEVKAATEEYLTNEDTLSAWIADCCERDAAAFETVTTLYRSFSRWCERNGEFSGGRKRFSEKLTSRGFEGERKNSGIGFKGLSVRLFEGQAAET